MPKYGRGLNRELVAMVNAGRIQEPFEIREVRQLIEIKGWNPSPTENYINCCLADGTSESHSSNYRKYFDSVGDGRYQLRQEFRSREWL
jgi:hypothetical protein